MMNRGIFSGRPCFSPVNCGIGINSRRKVYSGTGGRGTINSVPVEYNQEPVAATIESQEFTHYDNSPIELKEESQHQVLTNLSYIENPQSFELSGAEVGRTYQEKEVNPIDWMESQNSQPMYSTATTKLDYNSTFPIANSSVGQIHDAHNTKIYPVTTTKIYPVMTKTQSLYDQDYQDAFPQAMPTSSWSAPNQPNSPVEELDGTSTSVSMEPRGYSVDELLPTQHSQQFDFHDSSAISLGASITEPIKSKNQQTRSWNTNVGSQSLNDPWTNQQGYQEPSHSADAFTNISVPTNSSFNQARHMEMGQSFGSGNLASGIDMAEDAKILAQKAGG